MTGLRQGLVIDLEFVSQAWAFILEFYQHPPEWPAFAGGCATVNMR